MLVSTESNNKTPFSRFQSLCLSVKPLSRKL